MAKPKKGNVNRILAALPNGSASEIIDIGPSRWNKLNRTFFIGVGLVIFVFLLAWVGAWASPYDPILQDLRNGLQGPSWSNLLGTDQFGRDVLTRILYGMRIDLEIGILATAYTMLIGVAVGAITGFFGGWVDSIFMRFLDMLIAFPRLVLTIAVIAMLGQGIINMYIAIGIVGWIAYARLLRGEVLVAKETEYALAARTIGAKNSRIIWRHLMPNVITPCIVFAMSDVILNILYVSALGFLGLGVQPPTPEIGTMIADGRKLILTYPNLTTFPGLAVVLIGIAFSILGDGLADYLRPPQ
jgi:peptide/nickel transport system permease protein